MEMGEMCFVCFLNIIKNTWKASWKFPRGIIYDYFTFSLNQKYNKKPVKCLKL